MSKAPKKKATKKTGRPAAVSYEAFVKLWKSSTSVTAVAKALGIKVNSASTIAARLRAGGVDLARFPRRAPQIIDAKKLNKLRGAR